MKWHSGSNEALAQATNARSISLAGLQRRYVQQTALTESQSSRSAILRATSDTVSAAADTADDAAFTVFCDALTSFATTQSKGSVVSRGSVTAKGRQAHHLQDISVESGALPFKK